MVRIERRSAALRLRWNLDLRRRHTMVDGSYLMLLLGSGHPFPTGRPEHGVLKGSTSRHAVLLCQRRNFRFDIAQIFPRRGDVRDQRHQHANCELDIPGIVQPGRGLDDLIKANREGGISAAARCGFV